MAVPRTNRQEQERTPGQERRKRVLERRFSYDEVSYGRRQEQERRQEPECSLSWERRQEPEEEERRQEPGEEEEERRQEPEEQERRQEPEERRQEQERSAL